MKLSIFDLLSALGNAVVNSFWQMGLLWLLVMAVSKYRKNIAAPALSNLSFFALTAGFAAFIFTFFTSLFTASAATGAPALLQNSLLLKNATSLAAVLYLVLLAGPVIKLGMSLLYIGDLKRKGLHRVPGQYKIFLLDAVNHLGIRKKVKLWISDLADTPLTIGFFKPAILLPFSIVNNLSTQQVEAIILHELAHIRRNDYLINFLSQLIVTLLYFNPFAKQLLNIQNSEREKTADQWVLQFDYNNKMYAATLLHIAREHKVRQLKLALQAAGKCSPLYTRVQWIMGLKHRPSFTAGKMAASFTMVLLLLSFSVLLSRGGASMKTAPAVGQYNFGTAPVFAAIHKDEAPDEFAIKNIPIIETENSSKNNIVYLKQIEDPKTGKIEIVTPAEADDIQAFIFASATAPALSGEQEQTVQQHLALIKKIIAENNWKQIENDLGESVTSDEKSGLKELFMLLMANADWSRQEKLLKLAYNDINWTEVHSKLTLAVTDIKLDSVYNYYHSALDQYEALKNETTFASSAELSEKMAAAKKALKQIDSLRSKRIVEL